MGTPTLQFKRGLIANLPALKAGEPGFTTNTYDFYIGLDNNLANNKFFGSHRYWTKETASAGSGVNLVESTSGTDFITLAAPASVGAAVTYYFPATQGSSSSVLTNDGNGNLSWASGSANPVFTGIATFTNTTDNTLGNADTGAVQIDGGLGINKNVTVGKSLHVSENLNVIGLSTFNGIVVGNNGISVSGFSTIYNLHVLQDLNVNGSFDVDTSFTSSGNAIFSGITSFTDGTNSTNYDNGSLVIDGGVGIQKDVHIGGDLDVLGNVSIGGTFILVRGQDVYIENKDIILGYTTSITPNDDTANHAGVAIASTIGSPLVSFVASGINTLPDSYKQMMWFKSGTLGFSTDAFGFNYGVAVGTTSMANGVRLAVGSGVTVSDTAVSASTFYGTLVGNVSGSVSSSDQVKTVTASDLNATHYLTFVNSHNGSATSESVYTDDGIYYNPGTNTFTTQYGRFTGDLTVDGTIKASDGTTAITLSATTGNVGLSSNLTVNGNLYVLGSTTEVNTETLKVEDSLIEVGLINSGGSLVPPVSDLNIDVGVIFHYYTSSAKKAGVYWDDSVSRVVVSSDLSESSSVITSSTYAGLEIGSLWVNDCAGQSQVINCSGGIRTLENITVDGGAF